MPFQLVRKISLNAQLGPFGSFTELQSAVAREMPGCVAIPPLPNALSGECKSADGALIGRWEADPYRLVHPVSFTAYTGPCDTFEELEEAAGREIPGSKLLKPAKGSKDQHSGDVTDSLGRPIGKWQESR
jgi:hypothetical protein